MADTPFIPQGSGFLDPTLSQLLRKQALGQNLMQGVGDTAPVYSAFGAANRIFSPLVGAFLEKRSEKGLGDISKAAAPIYAQLAASDNPIALASASDNPLIRAMLPQLVNQQLENSFAAKGAGMKESAIGNAKLGYEPQLTGADTAAQYGQQLKYAPQIAGATANAQIPAEVAKAKALLPLEMAKLRASQAPEYAKLEEGKREFNAQNPLMGMGAGSLFGSNPASLYGGPTQ